MEGFEFYLKNLVVPLLIALFLLASTTLIINRLVYESRKFKKRVAKAKVDVFLTSLVFSPLDEEGFATQINKFKKRIPFQKKWCKEIILNEIINLKQNLKGQVTKDNIHFIYEQFELFQYSLSYLKNRKWYVKSLAFYHFQALEYSKAEEYVRPYLSHRNKALVSNAYIAYISLTSNKLDFLAEYKNPIRFTSTIKIMDVLHTKKIAKPSNLKDWLESENPSIVKLGLKFMVFYNELNYPDEILQLLYSKDEDIRKEAILASRELFISGAEELLIAQFESESKPNRLEILKTLASIGTQISESFLSILLNKYLDPDIKLEAIYTLNTINPFHFDHLSTYSDTVKSMIKHVKNPYI